MADNEHDHEGWFIIPVYQGTLLHGDGGGHRQGGRAREDLTSRHHHRGYSCTKDNKDKDSPVITVRDRS